MSGLPVGDAVLVQGLEKSFGEWPVLWDLNLTVGWGRVLVLFGANGAGKTTLLRILSTQTKADAGKAIIAGYDHRSAPDMVRRSVGVVAHRTFLYDDLTCRENLVYYARLFGIRNPQERINQALSRVGLSQRADQRIRTYSHGMQKRASIARAILHQPKVLILDEPEAGLDQESLATLRDVLEEWTDSGRSVLMTTHDVELGLSWAHETAVLAGGKIRFPSSDEYLDGAKLRKMLTPAVEAPL